MKSASCLRKSRSPATHPLHQAIFCHLKLSNRSTHCDAIPQFAYRAVVSDDIIPRLGFGIPPRPKQAYGPILDLSSPKLYLFSFMSRSYMIFWVVFSLFLIAHSSFFLTCSNPGLASLSCTVKTKLLWHSPEWPKICCFLAVSYLFKIFKRGD